MKDLDIKSFYKHDIPINKKPNKNTAGKIEDTSDNNQPVIKKRQKQKEKLNN